MASYAPALPTTGDTLERIFSAQRQRRATGVPITDRDLRAAYEGALNVEAGRRMQNRQLNFDMEMRNKYYNLQKRQIDNAEDAAAMGGIGQLASLGLTGLTYKDKIAAAFGYGGTPEAAAAPAAAMNPAITSGLSGGAAASAMPALSSSFASSFFPAAPSAAEALTGTVASGLSSGAPASAAGSMVGSEAFLGANAPIGGQAAAALGAEVAEATAPAVGASAAEAAGGSMLGAVAPAGVGMGVGGIARALGAPKGVAAGLGAATGIGSALMLSTGPVGWVLGGVLGIFGGLK